MSSNATKRKFNTLLQGIGSLSSKTGNNTSAHETGSSPSNRFTTSPSSANSASGVDVELLQKRRRLGFPDSTAPKLGKRANLSATISAIVSRKTQGQDSKGSTVAPARYAPTDRADLLKRLATFQEITDWTPKPEKVNEIEWAKRGWVCHRKETVRCLLCHRELVVKLNRKIVDGKEIPVLVASEIEEALVDKYADLIIASHQEDCLWRIRGCDDSLLRLSLTNASSSLAALRERYDELLARKSFLPYEFNLRLPDELDLDGVLSKLPGDFFTKPAPTKEAEAQPNRVALSLALLGWQGLNNPRIGAVPNSASCHTCLRRLGLWMFKSKEVGDNGEVLVPAPMDFLDPAREHRFFCPWSNFETQRQGHSQNRSGLDLPGWGVLVQTIANEAHLRSVYERRSSARPRTERSMGAPSTPQRPGTAASMNTPIATPGSVADGDNIGEDEKDRDAKDKERWARLRRVKSLFDTKGSRKLRHSISKSISRPGTANSAKSTKSVGGQKE
ncbi:NIPA-like protein [Fusarium austroafricanum]|uniref:NIPA-like protein n=1 Tax=Fusarium austroafricanum TaxID=2364996 RepID=A0A8H4KJ54_9HYPO|nr:NIPA-like protein [Fusarium austroafricanum]